MAKDRLGALKAVSANDLLTGAVVFLDREHRWTDDIRRADTVADPESASRLLGRAQADRDAAIVVEPTLIDVMATNGRLVPMRLRERVRAGGPTTTPVAPTRRPV